MIKDTLLILFFPFMVAALSVAVVYTIVQVVMTLVERVLATVIIGLMVPAILANTRDLYEFKLAILQGWEAMTCSNSK